MHAAPASPDGPHADPSDDRDVALSLSGDGEAFRRLIRRYQGEIGNQMRRFSRDSSVREELTHDVFVEAYLSLHSYRGTAPLLHWLRRIAVRVGYRYWTRRKGRDEEFRLSVEDWRRLAGKLPPPEEAAAAADLVHSLLARLAPTDRLVLTLLHLDGCSVAEAAERAGWSTVGTKVRAFRARRRLAKLLERYQP